MNESHSFDKSILRAYDIRGEVGKTLYAIDAEIIGRVFATLLNSSGKNSIVVCRDGRLSSPKLFKALIKGLNFSGADIIDIGIGPTPMLYFAAHYLKTDGAIMITGSHNASDFNGFKFMLGIDSFYGDDIIDLGEIAAKGKWSHKLGTLTKKSVKGQYIRALINSTNISDIKDSIKVAWDTGNGAAGEVLSSLVTSLPNENILINAEINGNFPAHHPDPSDPKNLEQLIDVVRSKNFDLGIALDGDGDRVGLVTRTGSIVWGDQILALLSKKVLKEFPGSNIVADIKVSEILNKEISRLGGNLTIWKTGHSLIKTKMKEIHSPLAGEMSGHIFISDRYYGYDDGIYAALRVLECVESKNYLDDFLGSLPTVFNTPEIRIECSDEDKFVIISKLAKKLENSKMRINKIDGLRVKYDKGWWLLRASNTENALVLRLEAESLEYLDFIKSEVKKYTLSYGLNIKL